MKQAFRQILSSGLGNSFKILGDDVIYPEAFKAYKDFKSKAKLIESGEEIDRINKVTSNLKTAIKNLKNKYSLKESNELIINYYICQNILTHQDLLNK